jgi:hypothetical protein
MERFEMPKTNPEADRIARLAETAARLAPSLDLERTPDLHVYRALDEAGIKDPGERKRLIGKIKAELHRRRPIPLSEREDLIEDARIQELRHPKDEDEA